jgi:hypothetical protein
MVTTQSYIILGLAFSSLFVLIQIKDAIPTLKAGGPSFDDLSPSPMKRFVSILGYVAALLSILLQSLAL